MRCAPPSTRSPCRTPTPPWSACDAVGRLLTIVPDSQITPTEVLERADQGLYEAKAFGPQTIVMVGGYEGLDGSPRASV